MQTSMATAKKNNVWIIFLFLVLVSLLSGIGNVIPFLGFLVSLLVTVPLANATFVSAYDSLGGKAKKK